MYFQNELLIRKSSLRTKLEMSQTASMLAKLGAFGKKAKQEKLKQEKEDIRQKVESASKINVVENVKNTELARMTLGVSVLIDGIAPLEFALAKFLLPGKDKPERDLPTSYSWEAFKEAVVGKLNDKISGEAKYGTFDYITKDGQDMKIVEDQDGFEVALNHLWHRRSENEVMAFQFRPESAEAQARRLVASVVNRPATTAPTEPEVEEQVASDDEETEVPEPTEEPTKAATSETAETAETTKNRASSQSPTATEERPSTSGTNVGAPGSLKRTKTTSKTRVADAFKKIIGKETADQKRLRLATLWEADRTFYKKGDDAEEEDLAQLAERDSEDGSISDEEDDDEEEISHEDKVVMK
jgi:hypothetical protein